MYLEAHGSVEDLRIGGDDVLPVHGDLRAGKARHPAPSKLIRGGWLLEGSSRKTSALIERPDLPALQGASAYCTSRGGRGTPV